MSFDEIRANIKYIQEELPHEEPYGMNLLCNLYYPKVEMETVQLLMSHKISCVEAAAFMQITPALVLYRLSGLHRNSDGTVKCIHKIIAKVSRPEVAQAFMSPAPEAIVTKLIASGQITKEQAELSKGVPMSQDICLEADSGGHTDQGVALVLLPSIQSLRRELMKKYQYFKPLRIGLAGGIGTPEAAAAAFIMGADFILTGSINQCTVEARISDNVKNLLQEINIQDTDYAPAGDMFEIGAKVQVLKKGVFFQPGPINYTCFTPTMVLWKRFQKPSKNKLKRNILKKVLKTFGKRFEATLLLKIVMKSFEKPKKISNLKWH